MKIEIPDIPAALNPKGLEVEVSSWGECKEGIWPLTYIQYHGWRKMDTGNKYADSKDSITARLVEPRYLFNGEMKTESECREILDRDYELCRAELITDNCFECPFVRNGLCALQGFNSPLDCGSGTNWRKKQPVEEWVTPTDEDAKKRPMVQAYDRDVAKCQEVRLLAVVKSTYVSEHDVYVVQSGDSVYFYSHCRMRKENKV